MSHHANVNEFPVRRMVCAGVGPRFSFPSDAEGTAARITDICARADQSTHNADPEKVIGMMLPHIDWFRGAPVYGKASLFAQQMPAPDVLIILGVNHTTPGTTTNYHLCDERYQTPFGVLPFSEPVIHTLYNEISAERLHRDARSHYRDWSVELPLPFLHHAWLESSALSLVPLICGNFGSFYGRPNGPLSDPNVEQFIDTLATIMRELHEKRKRFLIVPAVDLSHVGRFHGDTENAVGVLDQKIRDEDRDNLNTAASGDASTLFTKLERSRNWSNWDGLAALYTMLSAFERAELAVTGKLLEYVFTADAPSDNIVTCASMTWEIE